MRLPTASTREVLSRFGHLIGARKGAFAWLLFFQIAAAVAGVAGPMFVGHAINSVRGGTTPHYILLTVIGLAIATVAQVVLNFVAVYQAKTFGQRVFTDLRNGVVESVTHLPLDTVEAAGTGDLLGRTTNDVDRVAFFVETGMSRFIVTAVQIVVTLIAALIAAPKVGVVILVVALPIPLVTRWYVRRSMPAYLANSATTATFDGVVSETAEQATTVDAFSLGRTRLSRLDTHMTEMVNNEVYTAFLRSGFLAGLLGSVYLPVVLSVVWGGYLIGIGQTTLGAVTTVAMYCMQISRPLQGVAWQFENAQFAITSFARIFGVDLADRGEVRDETPHGEDLRVSGVCFTYDEAKRRARGEEKRDGSGGSGRREAAEIPDADMVLHDVTLDVVPGETLAIVGPSGAGKSTLGRLIAGINAPTRGSVTIGGADVARIPENELHSAVALVTQEHHVFSGSVADNLRLAKSEASDAEMRAALATVELDLDLDAQLGSGGRTLTAAEAQRLALARIVLLDPAILVLDEATSLLDPTAARSTERAMARVLAGRTVISIAHRLYTAHDADRVAVMGDGRILELGTHKELVARGGEYASLWETWMKS